MARHRLYSEFNYERKLEDDKVFLLNLIDDPVKTLNTYNIRIDEETIGAMRGASADIRKRAIELFREIAADSVQKCNCCGLLNPIER
jgi:hypothetical protein